jgi:phosphoribosylformylglycinamidine cyclo-ligase
MLRVFNCGVGMALVVSDAAAAMATLREAGEAPFLLGHVTDQPGIVIEGQERLFA